MEEKYGKLNEKFRKKIKHLILSQMKKTAESKVHDRFQRNAKNMKIYWKQDSQRQLRKHKYSVKQKGIPTDYQQTGGQKELQKS